MDFIFPVNITINKTNKKINSLLGIELVYGLIFLIFKLRVIDVFLWLSYYA